MFKYLSFVFLLSTFHFHVGVAQVYETFSDERLDSNPNWSIDMADWVVESGALRSNSDVASSTLQATFPSSLATVVEWSFNVTLKFNTSSNNYVDVFLMTEDADLSNSLASAYFVRIGNTKDEISLYKRFDGTTTEIIDGEDGRTASSNNRITVLVQRDSMSNWTLKADIDDGAGYRLEGSVMDTSISSSRYFGILVKQSTASFHKKHFFDNIRIGAIVEDTLAPIVEEVRVISSLQIDVVFNEEVSFLDTLNPFVSTFSNGSSYVAQKDSLNGALIHLILNESLPNQENISSKLSGIIDLSGNEIDTTFSFEVLFSEPSFVGDLVINELLFNPFSNGVDFVEIYNRSDKVLDLESFYFGNLENATFINLYPIIDSARFMFPGTYYAVCTDTLKLKAQYETGNLIETNRLPSMNNAEGSICLVSDSIIFDYLVYNEDMHYPLLKDVEGVSLERVDFNRLSTDKTNWHSASSLDDYGTPGRENSQYMEANETKQILSISPEVFSPDGDGTADVTSISYQLDEPGLKGNITIYDSNGRLVIRLMDNKLLGTNGVISWDGINENSEKERIGIYIVFFETLSMSGTIERYKRTVVLAGKI